MKTLTLNGIKGLKLPKGFKPSVIDGHICLLKPFARFDLSNWGDTHLLACACMAHWIEEYEKQTMGTRKALQCEYQFVQWQRVAFTKSKELR